MARVVLTSGLSGQYTGGETEIEVSASTFRALVRALDARFPGLGEHLEAEMAVAIDGEIFQDPFVEPIGPDSEVYFLPKIGGGIGSPAA
jgi:molybdopterin converting factor small subunit